MTQITDRSMRTAAFKPEADDDMLICRCEEITKGKIRRAVYEGMYEITEIRRWLRVGMGLCQGQTCTKLVQRIVAKELGVSPAQLESAAARGPVRPIEMACMGNEKGGVC